jgi:hypothetical protein
MPIKEEGQADYYNPSLFRMRVRRRALNSKDIFIV